MVDEQDTRALLVLAQDYYEGMVHGHEAQLTAVFDSAARFQGLRDHERISRDLGAFLEIVRNPDSTSLFDRSFHADVLDVSGPIAVVKVVGRFRGRIYTDYLSTLRTAAGWKIVNKTFWAWDSEPGA
jgi:hypothetical protein